MNFSPFLDAHDPLIVKKFIFFVLKKIQTSKTVQTAAIPEYFV